MIRKCNLEGCPINSKLGSSRWAIRCWEKDTDAASHLFFAFYSLSQDSVASKTLVSQTKCPPVLMQIFMTRIVIVVDLVLPMLFALLLRTKNFEITQHIESLFPLLNRVLPSPITLKRFAKRARENQSISQEPIPMRKPPPKKLKKNTGGSGFRMMFGKKDKVARSETPREPENGLQAPESGLGRRMFQLRMKPSPTIEPVEKSPVPSEGTKKPEPVLTHSTATSKSAARPPMTTTKYFGADHAFAKFHQGPMNNMPAFVSNDGSDDKAMTVRPPPPLNRQEVPKPESIDEECYEREEHPHTTSAPTRDDVSEESADLTCGIRKNAAERAARLSEEQSRRSQSQSNCTGEGETSGEETIERRVSCIPASASYW
ncbi:uncharacterized protein BDR25DRAFT_349147 [Lindgomyces ingoldianus]|uniref:Uncharacterized protein n=1 Tax=Lindgomyces ingoldianus TaxID=673940 RepID=A0ACB6RD00_9PLEO|nr:uncharacterized protein BDR25DRAFT_349147 [Lindgomyces ingoldianus]KAF2477213.1 hypothetical protein BDR25DRAFT_349147 [Lindgomyces ingoldianus]